MDMNENIPVIMEIVYPGLLATFGATAKYVHTIVTQRATFLWMFFFGNLFVAFFIGTLANAFLEQGFRFRDGIFMLCGVAALTIFSIGEKTFESIAQRFAHNISSKLGGDSQPPRKDDDNDNR